MTDRNMYTDDCLGGSVQQLDPLGRATTFAYDAVGRQTSILDARGVEAAFQYDAAGRLTRRMSTNDPPVTFAYDPVGNRTEAVDATGRSTFTYDLLNRRTGVVDPAGHGITYTYDAIGQRAAMTAPNGGIFTYAYGPRGQIDYLVNPQGDRTTFSYDSAARRTLTELTNGTRTSYTYDAASRVQQLYNLKADGSVILGLTYEHDPVGNPSTMLESSGDRVTRTYDATNRLTRELRSGPSAHDTAYAYDALGNRLVKDAFGALTTSTYDLANQLVTSQDANGDTTYTYDLAGNLHVVQQPTGARTTTTWDDQNRQIGVLQPTGAITTCIYRFDELRHSKEDSAATTKFLWDFNNYLAETDAADEIQAVYTNEPQQYGNLISQYRKGPTLWLPSYHHYDALGSTRALTDDAGDVTDTYLYDAWGNELAVSGSTVNPFRWVGRVGYYWDEGTGTFYIRARVYDPVTGRWMSQDPLSAGDDLDLYAYVRVQPLAHVDPSGTYWIRVGGAVVSSQAQPNARHRLSDGQRDWLIGFQAGARFPGSTTNHEHQEQVAQIAGCRKYYEETIKKDRVFLQCWSVVVRAANLLPPEQRDKCLALKIHCECCGGRGIASYRRPNHWIVLCAEQELFRKGPVRAAARRICHEMIHVLQYPPCNPTPLPEDCFHTVFREMVAYYCTGECTRGRGCLPLALTSVNSMVPSPCGPGRPTEEEQRQLADRLDADRRGGRACPPGITPELFR